VTAVIGVFNSLATSLGDLLFRLLDFLPPLWSLTLVSVASGLLMLVIFGRVSDQGKIRRAKEKIQGGLLATRLFRDDLGVFARVQGRIALDTVRYLTHSLKPMAFMILPVAVLLVQLNGRYGLRPLDVGEATIVKVGVSDPSLFAGDPDVSLLAGEGVAVETAALHIPAKAEIAWRVRPGREGAFTLTVMVGEERVEKELLAGGGGAMVTAARTGGSVFGMFLHPGEAPLKSPILHSVEVVYPPLEMKIAGWSVNWMVWFVVISLASGYLLKGLFGIEV
jgi:uncharacterized membrane protein (DUF106 family)